VRGPKPKPIEQRQREGNPGNRPLPEPVKLQPGQIVKPDDLPPAASKLWDDVVPVLEEARVLNRIDTAALLALCLQWHRAEQARVVLAKEGLFTFGSTGQIVEHPALGVERQAHQMFIRFAEQFGITPVARARIAAAVHGVAAATMEEELEALELTA
jgi:P27 family predicted phage terminase small subunit